MRKLIGALVFVFALPANAGEVFDSLKGACQLNRTNAFTVFTNQSANQSCAQACQAACETPTTCVKGWTVWASKIYNYDQECATAAIGAGVNPQGRICCCQSVGCTPKAETQIYPY